MSKVVRSHTRSRNGKPYKVKSFRKRKGKSSGLRMSDGLIEKIKKSKNC
jgi:hypothetical protein